MKLQVQHPDIAEFGLRLSNAPVVIGRHSDRAQLEFNWDQRISREHARLWSEQGQWWIEDLGSSNGCWLGNARLQGAQMLPVNTEVRIGGTSVRLSDEDSPWEKEDTELTEGENPLWPSNSSPGLEVWKENTAFDAIEDVFGLEAEALAAASTQLSPAAPAPKKPRPVLVDAQTIEFTLPAPHPSEPSAEQELLRTGLFVPCQQCPALGSRLSVKLKVGAASSQLSAEVVHVGMGPGGELGFGVQLSTAQRTSVAKAARKRLEAPTTDIPAPKVQKVVTAPKSKAPAAKRELSAKGAALLREIHRLLHAYKRQEYYRAFNLDALATDKELKTAMKAWNRRFAMTFSEFGVQEMVLISEAESALKKIHQTLSDPQLRLSYDFKTGHERIPERLKAVSRGEYTWDQLETAWREAFPKKIQRVEHLLALASEAEQTKDYLRVYELIDSAVKLAPFNQTLHKNRQQWIQYLSQQKN